MMADLALWFSYAIAVLAALYDVKTRIPNWSVILLAVAALGHTVLVATPSAAGSAALHMILALCVGMLLFRLRAIGAGDAKRRRWRYPCVRHPFCLAVQP